MNFRFLLACWYNTEMAEIFVEEISSPGCLHCKDFKDFWESIKGEWPHVRFKEIDVTTGEGQALVQKYMIFSSPGIIINGNLFSTGGVDKDKFVAKLKELSSLK